MATRLPVKPMLATLVDEPIDSDEWLFEPKLDGLRVLVTVKDGKASLLSRNGQPQGRLFPEIAEALPKAVKTSCVLDGEIVALDDRGRSSFRRLQQRFHLKDDAEVAVRRKAHPAVLFLFDVMRVGRKDVRDLTLSDRKELLAKTVRPSKTIRVVSGETSSGSRMFAAACRNGEEGVIGKLLSSPYVEGRSEAWIKVKCLLRQEFVVMGWTDPQRSRVALGALLVGYYDDDGELRYAGKVGTGFDHEMLYYLRERLEPLTIRDEAGTHWVKPELVAEIAFGEWTQNDLLRQPRFVGLRPDKAPRQCRREHGGSVHEVQVKASRRRRPSVSAEEGRAGA